MDGQEIAVRLSNSQKARLAYLQKICGLDSHLELANVALTLFKWVAKKITQGKIVGAILPEDERNCEKGDEFIALPLFECQPIFSSCAIPEEQKTTLRVMTVGLKAIGEIGGLIERTSMMDGEHLYGEAMDYFNAAVEQVVSGREIAALDLRGRRCRLLKLPVFDHIARNRGPFYE